MFLNIPRIRAIALLGLAALALAACGGPRGHSAQECMERAMYFESIRSSRDGMIAVGSVVMNRVESGQYPQSICGVVSQRGQFAPGIMTNDMRELPLVREAARAVIRGERHPYIQGAMFFHAANYRADYTNMHYVLVTGGNAFYERRPVHLVTQPTPPAAIEGVTGRWR